jgi:quercetin dioxygenase-like cupin family protein
MRVVRQGEASTQVVESMTYAGRQRPVSGVEVSWLSQGDVDDCGKAGYGLRLFTMAPKGEIPIHSHAYAQTIYVLSGRFECVAYDPETERVVERCEVGAGESVFVSPWEAHGMRNPSEDQAGRFLCCIGNWKHGEDAAPGS